MSNNHENNLEVSLLTPDEAERYTQIRHAAFRADINKIFYSNAPSNEPSAETFSAYTASVLTNLQSSTILYTKCVDKRTHTIIACARWTHNKPTSPTAPLRSAADLDQAHTIPEPYAETNRDMWNAFFELLHATEREVMGLRPFLKLDTLVTDPEHHRRGAGRLLLEEGLRRADREGVEVYLESSPMGRPLYARFGFEVVRDIELDLRRWGGEEVLVWTIMKRPAKGRA